MMYTVKQLADLAGISVRTLHYYDEIALLVPSAVGENGYRYYDAAALFRLQQILFYRELDFSLSEIKALLDDPAFSVVAALHAHRAALHAKALRLHDLIETVDNTILRLTGAITMSDDQLFKGFSAEEEQHYYEQAREMYDVQEVDVTYKRWNAYSQEKQDTIKAEGGAIYQDLAALVDDHAPVSDAVQTIVGRWHQHLRYFYEPSIMRLRGLSQLYVDSPDFAEKFRKLHADLPEFMQAAINHYCDGLAAE